MFLEFAIQKNEKNPSFEFKILNSRRRAKQRELAIKRSVVVFSEKMGVQGSFLRGIRFSCLKIFIKTRKPQKIKIYRHKLGIRNIRQQMLLAIVLSQWKLQIWLIIVLNQWNLNSVGPEIAELADSLADQFYGSLELLLCEIIGGIEQKQNIRAISVDFRPVRCRARAWWDNKVWLDFLWWWRLMSWLGSLLKKFETKNFLNLLVSQKSWLKNWIQLTESFQMTSNMLCFRPFWNFTYPCAFNFVVGPKFWKQSEPRHDGCHLKAHIVLNLKMLVWKWLFKNWTRFWRNKIRRFSKIWNFVNVKDYVIFVTKLVKQFC